MSEPLEAIEQGLRDRRGEELTRLLVEAPPQALAAALDNPDLEEAQILLMLRRPELSGELLARVAERRGLLGSYLVKAALVAHPHTPRNLALSLVKYLFWRDLARLLGNFQVAPAVRRAAELVLADRVSDISLGERMALARSAPREVVRSLRQDHDPRVIAALLENPRMTEDDAVAVAAHRRASAEVLGLVARNERWNNRPAVRLALLRNPRLPPAVAMTLLVALSDADLKLVTGRRDSPASLRLAAARLLRERLIRKAAGDRPHPPRRR